MGEPAIVINGRILTDGQAATVRVALEAFAKSLGDPDYLGEDEHGRAMTKAYADQVDNLRDLIFSKPEVQELPKTRFGMKR